MSLSRWTASTCGVAPIAVCARTRAASSASEVKNPRKTAGITVLHNLPSQGQSASRRTRRGPTGSSDESVLDRSGASARGPGGCACCRWVDLEPRPLARHRAHAGGGHERRGSSISSACTGAAAGRVELRTRSGSGPWSQWRTAAPEAEDRPDRGAPERTRLGWTVGNPWWAPGSTRLEVRTVGRVTRVRAWFVRSPAASVPIRQVAFTGSPKIVPRSGWRADEKIVRSAPRYAPVLRFAVVHHTAGSSSVPARRSRRRSCAGSSSTT